MRPRYIHLLAMILIIFEITFSFYISNYTSRIKKPIGEYRNNNEITCFDISYTGELLAVGDRNGFVSLITKNKLAPRWVYEGKNSIESVKLSASGEYLVALDQNDTISLFTYVPSIKDGQVVPRWKYHLPHAKIEGIYSSDSIPPLVYVLITSGENLYLLKTDGDLFWKFYTGAQHVNATISFDGSWVAAVDSSGKVYLFDIMASNPVWSFQTELRNASVEVSLNGGYVAVGGKDARNGGGSIYLLSLQTGDTIYHRQYGRPLRSISISTNGEKVFARGDDGTAVVLLFDGVSLDERLLRVPAGFDLIASTPFSSYIVGSGHGGDVYLMYLYRPEPLWVFYTNRESSKIAITQNGDFIFATQPHLIHLFTNTQFSEMIPGSRLGWGIVFFSSIVGGFLLIILNRKGLGRVTMTKGNYLIVTIGFTMGTTIGLMLLNELIQSVLLCGLGCVVGSVVRSRGKGISSFFSGCYMGCVGSVIGGFIMGTLIWLGGDEGSVIQLIFVNIVKGLNLGLLFGPMGAIIGTFMVNIFIRNMFSKVFH